MTITGIPTLNLSPRDNVILDIQLLIDEAVASPDDIAPYDLAAQIVEAVEAKIETMDDYGRILYRG